MTSTQDNLYQKYMNVYSAAYKEVLQHSCQHGANPFNTTVVSAIGSVWGTYRPAVYPEGILPYLCREVDLCCKSVSNYEKNSAWCGENNVMERGSQSERRCWPSLLQS
jgi:hypothetical protein